jgi:hypothetical protein
MSFRKITSDVISPELSKLNNPGFRLLNEIIAAQQMARRGPYITAIGALWPRMLTEREALSVFSSRLFSPGLYERESQVFRLGSMPGGIYIRLISTVQLS